jgi:hypothetical protein
MYNRIGCAGQGGQQQWAGVLFLPPLLSRKGRCSKLRLMQLALALWVGVNACYSSSTYVLHLVCLQGSVLSSLVRYFQVALRPYSGGHHALIPLCIFVIYKAQQEVQDVDRLGFLVPVTRGKENWQGTPSIQDVDGLSLSQPGSLSFRAYFPVHASMQTMCVV